MEVKFIKTRLFSYFMNGTESKLARMIFSDDSNVEKIWTNEIKTGSIYGTELEQNGKKYILTDGDTSKYFHQALMEIDNLINEYSKK